MYPQLDNEVTEFEKSAGKSIGVLIKVKDFKDISVGNYWIAGEFWTASGIHGNLNDNEIEEWYHIPKLGTGNKVI